MKRTVRLVPMILLFLLTQINAQEPRSLDVTELTIAEIHSRFKSGQLSCERLVQRYLDRIKKFDQPTRLNSIVVVNPQALQRARELDSQFRKTGKLLPLHGIPVVVKDNYDTHDLQTAAGSIALKDLLPPDDSYQVRKLREAGAIVLCKSNMAEWAYSPNFTESSIGGTTRNPYDLKRVPAGSSGGTAAAVAANLGAVGLGTDTGNSIRGPSAHCCLVGIRPTQGLTSRDGIVPLFLRNDIGGPMCRTVEDAARILEVIAGHDPHDPITAKAKGRKFEYISALDKQGLQGARIGVFRVLSQSPTADESFQRLFDQAIDDLKAQGAEIIDPFTIPGLDRPRLERLQNDLWVDTFRHDIEAYLKTRKAPLRNLNDIIQSRQHGPFLKGRLNASSKSKIPARLERPYSADAADDPNRASFLEKIVAAMEAQKIDAFVFPTWSNPPRLIGDLKSPAGNNSYQISPATGLPAITVPMGFNQQGLPAGLQMVGRAFSEAKLFKYAYAYEQAAQHRSAPKDFPTLD